MVRRCSQHWTSPGHLPPLTAITNLDILAAATRVRHEDVWRIAERYRRARGTAGAREIIGTAGAREIIGLMDGGSHSPEETRLRLLLIDAGIPRPQTDISVGSGFQAVRVPMGWPRLRVGVRYRHRPPPSGDCAIIELAAAEQLQLEGWLMVTVLPQHQGSQIHYAVRRALR